MERELASVGERIPEDQLSYERPSIEDYGTLAELTAGEGSTILDFFCGAQGDAIGYTACLS